jgi:RNA polymerase sigma factor (sigma-70 family)
MQNLTELVRQYKRTKSTILLGEIFGMLDKNLHKRAEYLFYQQKYNIGHKWVKLVDLKRMELDDVLQDLRVQILELISRYDVKKPFENYLFSTLQFWFPKCLRNRDSKTTLSALTESETTHGDSDESIFNHLTVPAVYPEDEFNSKEYFDDLSEMEKKVVDLFFEFPDKTQVEVAEILGVTQQRVAQLISNIRVKYNRPL